MRRMWREGRLEEGAKGTRSKEGDGNREGSSEEVN